MADALIDLVSLAEAKQYFTDIGQAPPADPALVRLITQVSRQMQAYIDRRLVSQAYTDTIDGKEAVRMSAPQYPITAVASVSVDGHAIPSGAATATTCGFVFNTTQVMLRGFRFCRGMQNVVISYTAGFTTIPDDLKAATFEAIGVVLAGQASEDGRAIVTQAGGTKLEYGSIQDQLETIYGPNVTNALMSYDRKSMGW